MNKNNNFYILEKLKELCLSAESLKKPLLCYLSKQSLDQNDLEKVFSILASHLPLEGNVNFIVKSFGPFTIELLYRTVHLLPTLNEWEELLKHEQMSICFCYLTSHKIPGLKEFTLSYFKKFGPPFKRLSILNKLKQDQTKRRKKMLPNWYSDVLEATYIILKHFPSILSLQWKWSDLFICLNCEEFQLSETSIWSLKHCFAFIFGLSSPGHKSFNDEEKILLKLTNQFFQDSFNKHIPFEKQQILSSISLSPEVCAICNVLLHKNPLKSTERTSTNDFFVTDSLMCHVQEFVLAIREGNAVLLEGPVGCGKTALVEYIAERTGYSKPPFLNKIQLSDDTDSKTLTGTYVCSNVPGQFLWQPGLLVQACKEGYWILLEDIDMAPMDVISLLLPIVESGQLVVPGHYNKAIDVSSAFRLFMTRRNTFSSSVASNTGVNMIMKHVKTVKLKNIPENDLKEVIITKYPNLSTIVDKLLTIYQNLKSSKYLFQNSFVRKPSTRDLLKWCRRVSNCVNLHGTDEFNLIVALAAIDCFVASSPNPNIRLQMTKIITIELNISADKAEYYCNSYKPTIEQTKEKFKVGCSSLSKLISPSLGFIIVSKQPFAFTRHSSVLLERITSCIVACEPVLLVGETGVGKTSALQYLAEETGRKLHVINMSQQSSSSDLLGGYKPAQLCHLFAPVREEFERLFPQTFSMKQNSKFLGHIQNCFFNRRYYDLWQLLLHSTKAAVKMLTEDKNPSSGILLSSWQQVLSDLSNLRQKLKADSPIAFNFVEGKLSRCIERGDWLLLDEINLASSDTLECLSCVLESESGSIVLMERGDAKPLARHKEFRLFAAMNPATDVGKRNLPEGVQNRFTEIFVDEPTDRNDIAIIVAYYLNKRTVAALPAVDGIVQFYLEVRKLSDKLLDGAGRKPHYSLRTLCRALRYIVDNSAVTLQKSLYEGFCLSFLTALDRSSHPLVVNLIAQHVVGKTNLKSILKIPMPKPDYLSVEIEGHHIRCGVLDPFHMQHYILTPSVKENLRELARPVSYGKYPILIQGETSTGKTSLVKYLAAATGNKVIRINNHEHTDLQEYVGYYSSDKDGKLIFQDGPLVTAMREGHWVILDELNLAPTDILEALNRVLDDNRELFVTETQEVIRAHPRFTLFATQNPPGLYGGRKILSRAFRNRFVELHFDEIPTEELQTILHQRCDLAPSFCKKLIKVMLDLQARRKASGLFSGKHGFMTLRDLFRWAERHRRFKLSDSSLYDWEQHLVDDGYLLLAGKVRKAEEEKVIEDVLKKHFSRTVDLDKLFGMNKIHEMVKELPNQFSHLVWTKPMRRLFVTVERALRFDEPVLLVGETGGGKTTACQLISKIMNKNLSIINCHANTEAADFIGGLRPARNREQIEQQQSEDVTECSTKSVKLFEWLDGPLVQAMNDGNHILIDEISLADDSVLERLNSVLEPERTLVIPDKTTVAGDDDGTNSGAFVVAKSGFQFLATMNPGGDYGKKELSPALRNRMTEVWCDVIQEKKDLIAIIEHNLHLSSLANCTSISTPPETYAKMIVGFVNWFKQTLFGKRFVISVRDLITWSNFMSLTSGLLDLPSTFVHAACLVYIDGLGSGLSGCFASQSNQAHSECLNFIVKQLKAENQYSVMSDSTKQWLESEINGHSEVEKHVVRTENAFGIGSFTIKRGPSQNSQVESFSFGAHTTSINALRVMRALQLPRPILLEGSPGGGKTSLVAAIAKASGYSLIRINLSEQTDASDLFGADLPLENGKGGEFSWRDGPLLSAMKAGNWVVLDELNLASQSVLESLNSVFDHRGELYVPELDRRFQVDRSQTKIFACQNPLQEGGGRKGLPKSFLNRFTQVHVDNLTRHDLLFILSTCHPKIEQNVLERMVEFNQKINEEIVIKKLWGHRGAPWEFNLRDLTRWCELVMVDSELDKDKAACNHASLIYFERLRSAVDRKKSFELFVNSFGHEPYLPTRYFHIDDKTLQIGNTALTRNSEYYSSSKYDFILLPSLLHPAESLLQTLNQNWPCILTGPASSGKTLLAHIVAGLSGRRLRVLSMNSGMDAIELLGGYEQSDASNAALELIDNIIKVLNKVCQAILVAGSLEKELHRFEPLMLTIEKLKFISTRVESKQSENNSENFLAAVVDEIAKVLNFCQNSLKDHTATHLIQDNLLKLQALLLQQDTKGSYSWSDSILVRALRDGDWLLVDGANFCSASVLDRLNALLEPNGILTVTERGVVDGNVPEVVPHKDFRLILSLDPFYGELSRAMRNRCVEIHLPGDSFYDAFTSIDGYTPIQHEGLDWDEVNKIGISKCQGHHEFIAWQRLFENSDFKEKNSKVEVLSKFDDILSRMRCGLDCDLVADLSPSSCEASTLRVCSPSVRDFILHPTLSIVLTQFKLLENIFSFQRLKYNSEAVQTSVFRILLELATSNDFSYRKKLMDQFCSKQLREDGTNHLKFIFSTLIDKIFSSELLNKLEMKQGFNLPWDPRWALQSLNFPAESNSHFFFFDKILLNVVYLHLKFELDRLNVPFSSKNKKSLIKKASTFQLANAFSSKLLQISSLPHRSLIYLLPLYDAWNSFASEVFSSSDQSPVKGFQFTLCEGSLRQISFIWRTIFATNFNLPSFTTQYLQLRTEIQKFVRYLNAENLSSCLSLLDLLQCIDKSVKLDKEFGTDYKLQNKIRCAMQFDPITKFFNAQQCLIAPCIQFLLRDFSKYVSLVRTKDGFLTKLTWADVLSILGDFVVLSQSLVSRIEAEGCDSDKNLTLSLKELIDRLRDAGVHLTTYTIDLLHSASVEVEKLKPENGTLSIFGVSHLSIELSILHNFHFVLSQMTYFSPFSTDNQFSGQDVANVLFQLPCLDLRTCFQLLRFQVEENLCWRSFLCSSLLKWPYHAQLSNEIEDDLSFTDGIDFELDGLSNLMRPFVSQKSLEILYKDSSDRSMGIRSLSEMENNLWDKSRVSLDQVDAKLQQLDAFIICLWRNANSSSFHSCPGANLSFPSQLVHSVCGVLSAFSCSLSVCKKSDFKIHLLVTEPMADICENLHELTSVILRDCGHPSTPLLLSIKRLDTSLLEITDVAKKQPPSELPWCQLVLKVLSKCSESLSKILITIKTDERKLSLKERKEKITNCWKSCGEAWTWCGYLQLLLVSARGPVDPVERCKFKVNCCSAELLQLSCDLEIRNISHQNLTGHNLHASGQLQNKYAHPNVNQSLEHRKKIEKSIEKNKQKVIYRPKDAQFDQLSKVCTSFMKTIGEFISFKSYVKQLSSDKLDEIELKTEEKYQHNFASFSLSLEKNFSAYPDFVKPVTDAVSQIRFGLRLVRAAGVISSIHHQQQNKLVHLTNVNQTTEEFFIQYLTGNLIDIDGTVALLKSIPSKDLPSYCSDKIIDNILMSSLLLLRSKALRNCYGPTVFSELLRLSEMIVAMWNNHEKKKEEKEAEKESLFKYKPREHMMDTEEELENKEFKTMFPTFDEDLVEFASSDEWNTSPHLVVENAQQQDEAEDLEISQKAFDVAAIIHTAVSKYLAVPIIESDEPKLKCNFSVQTDENSPSINMLPLLLSHSILSLPVKESLSTLYGSELDHSLVPQHLLVACQLKAALSSQACADMKKQVMNVYCDSLPCETSKCLPVLLNFRSSLTDHLLKEWPEHPLLNVLLVVIDRILKFSVTSPIMKFVSALEHLLCKAQDWEMNAGHHVSLSTHLEAITSLVIDWRKLELKSWYRLLDDAREKASAGATKWWFYIYQLIEECIQKMQATDDSSHAVDVVTSLQKFIESSTIGEFHSRLQLVHAFYCHLEMKSRGKDVLAVALQNMYTYYGQFTRATEDRISFLRIPIETELKDYVKIAKWNDLNFYALKESVRKTHHTLFKLTKKFSKTLLEPIAASILSAIPSSFSLTQQNVHSKGLAIALRLKEASEKKDYSSKSRDINSDFAALLKPCLDQLKSDDLRLKEVCRLPTILAKMTKHRTMWAKEIDSFMPDLFIDFENIIASVVVNFKELRSLEPVTPLSKDEEQREKRLSEAKHIRARKHRALSDLFKLLRTMGLSYRKGLIWAKTFDYKEIMLCPFSKDNFNLPNSDCVSITSEEISSTLSDATRYFFKMVSKWSALQAACRTPNKDVIGNVLDRLTGSVGHLMNLGLHQRQNIGRLSDVVSGMTELLSNLKTHQEHDKDELLSISGQSLKKVISCKMMLDKWGEALLYFKQLIQCWPSSTEQAFIIPNQQLPRSAQSCYGDRLWADVMERTNKEINKIKLANEVLSRQLSYYCDKSGQIKRGIIVLPTLSSLISSTIASSHESAVCFCDEMTTIFDTKLSKSNDILTRSPLLRSILQGRNDVLSFVDEMEAKQDHPSIEICPDEILLDLNKLLTRVMLAMQDLIKNSNGIDDAISTDEGLLESHLIHHLHNRTSEYFQSLNVVDLYENIVNFIEKIKHFTNVNLRSVVFRLVLRSLVPLLDEYLGLLCHSLSLLGIVNRTTCKFACILAAISTEIIQKGFCPPAEFEEEMSGDETGKFKEAEDCGIGEGEGSKDVSDQIEEESQVEDRPDEKKEEQKEDIPDEEEAIEMSNDFEGKFQEDNLKDQKEDNDDDDENEDEELEKQMGDLGDENEAEKLDERMWGSDEEDDERNETDKKKEEKGKGMDAEESELAAKDEDLKDQKGEEEQQGDQSEFNPDERDDIHEKEPDEEPEPLEIPDRPEFGEPANDEEDEATEDEKETKESEVTELPPDAEESKEDDVEGKEEEKQEGENKETDQKDDVEDENINDERNQEDISPEDDAIVDESDEEEEGTKEEEAKEPALDEEENHKEEKMEEEKIEEEDKEGGLGKQLPIEEEKVEEKVPEETQRSERIDTEDNIEQCETANEDIMKQAIEKGEDRETSGMAPSADVHGDQSQLAAPQSIQENKPELDLPAENERKSGESDAKRSLGDVEDIMPKKLKLMDELKEKEEETKPNEANENIELYQHISEDLKHYDKQTRDAATEEQMKKQPIEMEDQREEEIVTDDEAEKENQTEMTYTELNEDSDVKEVENRAVPITDEEMVIHVDSEEKEEDEKSYRAKNQVVEERDLLSSIHTNITDWEPSSDFMSLTPEELAKLRKEMEDHLRSLSTEEDQVEFSEAELMWHQYQSLTQPLSQQLSEQLRLILEPTRAAKLKGDYRTGKRLNMRKVIPYIASGFRKDKIWLRRSKPSKREYQIMVAVDDSSSMADNHTKQLAFESLAVISTALTTIEAGQLSVCKFGEETKLLHDFGQPFTDQSGAMILQQCSFKQEQTKIAKLLDTCVKFLKAAQTSYTSSADPRLSQLLVIVSDGRGLYIEGKERVEAAVRAAKDARVFLAFIILDNPAMKDSILDIKVPVFKESGKIDIRSYMCDFPFPFYVIIRNINSLPETLSEALRQWFEIVASRD